MVVATKPKYLFNVNEPVGDVFKPKQLTTGDKFGLELELEFDPDKLKLPNPVLPWKVPKGWQQKEDGSLRNGLEFVSSGPRAYEDIMADIPNIEKMFRDANVVPVTSYRTSAHLHINAQDLTIKQLATFMAVYAILEPLLIESGGPERRGNIFCIPVGESLPLQKMWKGLMGVEKYPERDDQNVAWYLNENRYKYSALNLCQIRNFGTIEMRTHHGAWREEELAPWVQIWASLRKIIVEETDLNPIKVCEEYKRLGSTRFVSRWAPTLLRHVANLRKDMDKGFWFAQDFAASRTTRWDESPVEPKIRCLDSWEQWLNTFTKSAQHTLGRFNYNTFINYETRLEAEMYIMGQYGTDQVIAFADKAMRAWYADTSSTLDVTKLTLGQALSFMHPQWRYKFFREQAKGNTIVNWVDKIKEWLPGEDVKGISVWRPGAAQILINNPFLAEKPLPTIEPEAPVVGGRFGLEAGVMDAIRRQQAANAAWMNEPPVAVPPMRPARTQNLPPRPPRRVATARPVAPRPPVIDDEDDF